MLAVDQLVSANLKEIRMSVTKAMRALLSESSSPYAKALADLLGGIEKDYRGIMSKLKQALPDFETKEVPSQWGKTYPVFVFTRKDEEQDSFSVTGGYSLVGNYNRVDRTTDMTLSTGVTTWLQFSGGDDFPGEQINGTIDNTSDFIAQVVKRIASKSADAAPPNYTGDTETDKLMARVDKLFRIGKSPDDIASEIAKVVRPMLPSTYKWKGDNGKKALEALARDGRYKFTHGLDLDPKKGPSAYYEFVGTREVEGLEDKFVLGIVISRGTAVSWFEKKYPLAFAWINAVKTPGASKYAVGKASGEWPNQGRFNDTLKQALANIEYAKNNYKAALGQDSDTLPPNFANFD